MPEVAAATNSELIAELASRIGFTGVVVSASLTPNPLNGRDVIEVFSSPVTDGRRRVNLLRAAADRIERS